MARSLKLTTNLSVHVDGRILQLTSAIYSESHGRLPQVELVAGKTKVLLPYMQAPAELRKLFSKRFGVNADYGLKPVIG